MGVDEQLLAGLGVAHHEQRRDRATPSPTDRRAAPPMISWRRAKWASGLAQPGALMKSETTKTRDRLCMTRKAVCRKSRRFVAADREALGPGKHPVENMERVAPTAPRGNHGVDAVAIKQARRRDCRDGSKAAPAR